MPTKAVRLTHLLVGENTLRYLVMVPEASVLIRQNGVAATVYADNAKTPLANPVPKGVAVGAAGVDTKGRLLVYLNPGKGYDAQATVGTLVSVAALPDVGVDVEDVQAPIPAGTFVNLAGAETLTGPKTLQGDAAATSVLGTRVTGDAFARRQILASGELTSGDGTGAPVRALWTSAGSTAVGRGAGASDTSGSLTATGVNALYSNTTGANNTATGVYALTSNTTGANNTATGLNALYSNTTGVNNTATGVYALTSNTTGANNTATGVNALYSNTTGDNNTATGLNALYSNTTGASNTATGAYALRLNTTGANNTATGVYALTSNTTGANNTTTGLNALYSNTTGVNNTATGVYALTSNTTGANNTTTGVNALYSNTTGDNNTTTGLNALYSNTTGVNNTTTGVYALYAPAGVVANATTTGLRQVAVGAESGQASPTQRNDVVAVGYRALVDADFAIAVGSGAQALHATSIALGAVTTAAAQVMIGARDLEITATAKGIVGRSPDGTRYRIQIANGGILTTVAA